jgi:hypothetical protein
MGHEVVQLAVRDAHQHGNLVIVQPEGNGDHVIVETLVAKPDRDRMESWELSDGRLSIHTSTVRGERGKFLSESYSVLGVGLLSRGPWEGVCQRAAIGNPELDESTLEVVFDRPGRKLQR